MNGQCPRASGSARIQQHSSSSIALAPQPPARVRARSAAPQALLSGLPTVAGSPAAMSTGWPDLPCEIVDQIVHHLPPRDVVSLACADNPTHMKLHDWLAFLHVSVRAEQARAFNEVRTVVREIRGLKRADLRGQPLAAIARKLEDFPCTHWLFAFMAVRNAAKEVPARERVATVQALAQQIGRLMPPERSDEMRRVAQETRQFSSEGAAQVLAALGQTIVKLEVAQRRVMLEHLLGAVVALPVVHRPIPLTELVGAFHSLPRVDRAPTFRQLVSEIGQLQARHRARPLEGLIAWTEGFSAKTSSAAYQQMVRIVRDLPPGDIARPMIRLIRIAPRLGGDDCLQRYQELVDASSALSPMDRAATLQELVIQVRAFPASARRPAFECVAKAVQSAPESCTNTTMIILMSQARDLPAPVSRRLDKLRAERYPVKRE